MTVSESSKGVLFAVDDDPDVLETLKILLASEAWEVVTFRSPAPALSELASRTPDLVLLDLNYTQDTTGGREGLEFLKRIREFDAEIPVIVMTAWSSVPLAVEVMANGAKDFLEKPFEPARLKSALRTQLSLRRALLKSRILDAELERLQGRTGPVFIAGSPAMLQVAAVVRKVAPSSANVLITGEPGTGKEVVARMLHALSQRAQRPMVSVNAGGLPDSLFESELFGHVKGAFTDARTDRTGRFELAHLGTLFLDEIGNVPLALQAKLLRVLESGEMERIGSSYTRRVDVRVISATNSDLDSAIAAGRFREDLLYRLNTVEIALPPLRERREDIPELAAHFLAQHAKKYGKEIFGFEPDAMAWVLAYSWPGNVRELNHALERAVIMSSGTRLALADLQTNTRKAAPVSLEEVSLEEVEEILIRKALTRAAGNVSVAAKALGLSRSALYRRMQTYGI
ncbi:sigma-54 dependent transcriptional regulator [Nostoc sp. NIES-2111]